MSRTFRSLRIRNFRLFLVGQLVSQAGSWMRMVAMALLVFNVTDDGVAVGVLVACQFFPVLLLGPWAGLVADRADKRKLLLIVQSCLMGQSFVLAALAASGDPPVLAIYAVALAGGFATALDNPTRRSFVVEMVPESHVQNAVSLNTAVMTGSRIFGPAIAGLLVSTVGYAWCFVGDGLSYTAVLAGLWLMRTEELRPAPPASRGKGQVRAGLRYVRQTPALFIPLVMMTVVGTLAFNFQVVLPVFVKRTLGGSDAQFTLLFSALSVGSMAGALWSAQRTVVRLRHIVLATFAYGIAMLVLAVMPTLALAYPAAVLVGMSSVVFMTTSTTMLQLRADPSMRGRALALQSMVFLGSTPIGGPIIGWVSERLGARVGLGVGGVACLAAAAYGALAGRRLLQRGLSIDGERPLESSGADLQRA
ncbi:MAG TPA: MFS transporter [Acidimicrobiales bacterium]|nr:MFS transporter [Acidimicrobiales bacterium]